VKSTPSIRLAQLPPSSQKGPPIAPKPAEPVPQKPDLRLPADVVRASKTGAKPLSEHLKKAEERRRGEEQEKKPAARSTPAQRGAPRSDGPLTRDRKRGKDLPAKEAEESPKPSLGG